MQTKIVLCVLLLAVNASNVMASDLQGAAREAIREGDLVWLESLIDSGLDVSSDPYLVHFAVWRGRPEVLRKLLSAGGDVDALWGKDTRLALLQTSPYLAGVGRKKQQAGNGATAARRGRKCQRKGS